MKSAPLVYLSISTMETCVESARRNGMIEAAWETVGQLAHLLKIRQTEIDLTGADVKAVDILRNIALWDYLSHPTPVVGKRAVEALLDAALYELQLRDGSKDVFFDAVIDAIDKIAGPAAHTSGVRFDLFPAYSEMHQASMQGLVQFAASRVKPANSSEAWIDTCGAFDEVVERIQIHFRNVAEAQDFGSALFLTHTLRSLRKCAAAVIDLLASSPQGAERWIQTLERRLSWLVAVFPRFFHQKETVSPSLANDACKELACLGIRLIDMGRAKLVEQCAREIRTIVQDYCATGSAECHWIADLFVNLHWIALAAKNLGDNELATTVRAKWERPNNLPKDKWSASLEVLAQRIAYFDEELNRTGGPHFYSEGPRAELLRVMQRKA